MKEENERGRDRERQLRANNMKIADLCRLEHYSTVGCRRTGGRRSQPGSFLFFTTPAYLVLILQSVFESRRLACSAHTVCDDARRNCKAPSTVETREVHPKTRHLLTVYCHPKKTRLKTRLVCGTSTQTLPEVPPKEHSTNLLGDERRWALVDSSQVLHNQLSTLCLSSTTLTTDDDALVRSGLHHLSKRCATDGEDVSRQLADQLAFILAHVVHAVAVVHLVWIDGHQDSSSVGVNALIVVTSANVFQERTFMEVTKAK